PELQIQYADYAEWQQEWLQGDALGAQLNYWRKQLDQAPPSLDLPADHPRSAAEKAGGATESFTIPQPVHSGLKILSQQESSTLFMTLAAAFNVLLYRYTDRDDIVVGTPIANRNRPEVEWLIGLFVNTLALRTDLSGDPTFRELLGRVRDTAIKAYAHQDMPFEKLVQELHPERDLTRTPLFQVMFALQNVPLAPLNLAGLSVSPFEASGQGSMFDLTLTLMERADETTGGRSELLGYLEYNTSFFDRSRIIRMREHFKNLLKSIISDPDRPVSQLLLLSLEEEHRLLVEFNQTDSDYPGDVCVHGLFEAQVKKSPEAKAAIFQRRTISYGELDRRSN